MGQASHGVRGWRGRRLRRCLGVASMELPVQLRNPVVPVAASSRAHPVAVTAERQLGEPEDRDQAEDPMSVHWCSLRLSLFEWTSGSSASDVEIV